MGIQFLQTPPGWLQITATQTAITGIDFCQRSCDAVEQPTVLTQRAAQQLTEYFAGQRQTFELPLDQTGTDFQQQVWEALMRIPYGETRSYSELAQMIGNPKAVRAVGGANNKNHLAIVVPCHRVIGKNGQLVGYAGGIERKMYLLALEQHNLGNNEK